MTEFKMNPKSLRYCLLVPFPAILWFLNPSREWREMQILLPLMILLVAFLLLNYQTTFQITSDTYIVNSVLKTQRFDKKQHTLRAIGSRRVGTRQGRSTVYQINIIDRKTLLTVKELRMNMSTTQYNDMYTTLRKLKEFNTAATNK